MIDKKEIKEKGLVNVIPIKTVKLDGNNKNKTTIAFLDTDTFKSRRKEDHGVEK